MALATAIATSLLSLVFKGFLPPTPAPSCASFPPRQAMGLGQCKANEKLPGSMVIPGGIFNTFGKHSSASSGQGWPHHQMAWSEGNCTGNLHLFPAYTCWNYLGVQKNPPAPKAPVV
jgi:hypothetical protein